MNRLHPMNNWLKRRPTPRQDGPQGFLTRLRKDVRGTTLAMMGASLVPLLAFTGASVDMARLYVVKVRLQQACDAGVLAGRKFMTSNILDDNSKDKAENFFQNNFRQGWFQTKAVEFRPQATADGQLEATAKTIVPLSIMQFFGGKEVQLETSCQARLDVADVDIMFVLDTTGSMACTPARSSSSCSSYVGSVTATQVGNVWSVPEEGGSRISALRLAVMDFYDTLEAAADETTNIRYGVVPYTSTVNVGRIIPTNFLVTDTWRYQSRRLLGDAVHSTSNPPAQTGVSQTACNNMAGRNPATGYNANREAVVTTVTWSAASGGTCTRTVRTMRPNFRYEPVDIDVSQYVLGNTVPDPTKVSGQTAQWTGCIEERNTTASASFPPLPPDLDIDLAPTDRATRWRPMWASVVYGRDNAYATSTQDSVDASADGSLRARGTNSLNQAGYNVCVKQASRLAEMSRSDLSNYVNAADFTAHGGTYHDVGLIWGARFISPTGPFANDTAAHPNRNPPNRHIIFMTDGDMAPNAGIYGLYGYETLDRRVTTDGSSGLLDRHNARFTAICDAAKARNITLWVVAFAQTMTTRLQNCASPGKAYYASNQTELRDAFKKIAQQIAELRISK
jgi:Flp pilus assembly protein TadG